MLLLPGFTVPCPRCQHHTVRVRQVEWQEGPFRRRSTWVDEPPTGLRCARGCALTSEQVVRLLLEADRTHLGAVAGGEAYQLPLPLEAA